MVRSAKAPGQNSIGTGGQYSLGRNTVIQKINADVNKVLDTGDTRQKLTSQGFEVFGGTPDEFSATIKSDTKIFADALRKAGISAN